MNNELNLSWTSDLLVIKNLFIIIVIMLHLQIYLKIHKIIFSGLG